MPADHASQPLRMLGYLRVSTDEQAVSGLGLADQEAVVRAEAGRRGWDLTVIRDPAASGASLDRPGLTRALELLATRQADGLVVSKLDRLSRSVVDFATLVDWCYDGGITLVVLDLGVDTSTPSGQVVANVMAAFAQFERQMIGARTRAALGALRAQGKPTGPPAVADKPALLARISELRAQGWSLQRIADLLNSEQVPTLRGGSEWRPSSVQSAAGYKRPRPRRKTMVLPDTRKR